jgi:8-oxo-dGTP pyrophosphatase MutT (NUDIX family)
MAALEVPFDRLSPALFRQRASERLSAPAPWSVPRAAVTAAEIAPSDFDLNPGAFKEWKGDAPARPAAVLIPVVARAHLSVILTQRTDQLPAHSGQIAFPGGKPDVGDVDPVATAMREAAEEIGLDRAFIEPLGILDNYRTGTGFAVTPVVALIDPACTLTPDPREVADVFEVPLAFLMDPTNHQVHTRAIAGRDRQYYAMPFGDRYIWGATAGMVRNMQERLFKP